MAKHEHVDRIKPKDMGVGIHSFPDTHGAYWTDAGFDASTTNVKGRREIADALKIDLADLVSFDPSGHTADVVVVDQLSGLEQIQFDQETSTTLGAVGRVLGWHEPLSSPAIEPEKGAGPGTYDGIILVGKETFNGKHLLVTGADCTPVGVRGKLYSGDEFIAVLHGGRKGTLGGITANLAKHLRFLGVQSDTVEVYIGPAAQAIEVETELLDKNGGEDYSWRAQSVSEEYVDSVNGKTKTKYNNHYDTMRRIIDDLGIRDKQVHIIDSDTESSAGLHSFRRDKTTARNSLVISF